MDINDGPEVRELRKRWLAGGSALPVVELLASRGAKIEAATCARLALAKPDCPDAVEPRTVRAGLSSPPAGWDETRAGFARSPSAERWRDLMRFIPDVAFVRERATPEQKDLLDHARIPPSWTEPENHGTS